MGTWDIKILRCSGLIKTNPWKVLLDNNYSYVNTPTKTAEDVRYRAPSILRGEKKST